MTRTILCIVKPGDPPAVGKPGIDRPRLERPPNRHDDFRLAVLIYVGDLHQSYFPLRWSGPEACGVAQYGDLPVAGDNPFHRSVRIQVGFE